MSRTEEVIGAFENFCVSLGGKAREIFERIGEKTIICELPRRRRISIYVAKGLYESDVYLGTKDDREMEVITAKSISLNFENVKELEENVNLYTSAEITTTKLKMRYGAFGEVIFEA